MFPSGDEAALAAGVDGNSRRTSTRRAAGARVLGDRVTREYDWDKATDATEDGVRSQFCRR